MSQSWLPEANPYLAAMGPGSEVPEAVVACIDTIVNLFREGSNLVQEIKDRRDSQRERAERNSENESTRTEELELSLARGASVVRAQYSRDVGRLGSVFAEGDQIATDTLGDIAANLQSQVIFDLKKVWQQDIQVNFLPLLDASDVCQDRAVMSLMQLHQRILMTAPEFEPSVSPLRISPLRITPWKDSQLPIQGARESIISSSSGSPTSVYSMHRDSWGTLATTPPSRPSTLASNHAFSTTSTAPIPIPMRSPEREKRWSSFGARKSKLGEEQPPDSKRTSLVAAAPPPPPLPQDNNYIRAVSGNSIPQALRVGRQVNSASGNFLAPAPRDGHQANAMSGYFANGAGSAAARQFELLKAESQAHGNSNRGLEPDASEFNPWSGGHLSTHMNQDDVQFSSAHQNATPPGSDLGQSNNQTARSTWIPQDRSIRSDRSHHNSTASSVSIRTMSSGTGSMMSSTIPAMPSRTGHSSFTSATSPISPSLASLPGALSSKGMLPGEHNKYAGLCKGAWRLQIGDRKKAIEKHSRPARMYVAISYWKCSKCSFEGPMIKGAKGEKAIDTKVYGSNGVLYRWEFLFKSHIHIKDRLTNQMDSNFGCMFCCAEGRGTPIFGGVQHFLSHLQEHRLRPPTGEVLYRMGCVAGRPVDPAEEFDVALPPL